MNTIAAFCDTCASEGKIRLAYGMYLTDNGRKADVCRAHYQQLDGEVEKRPYRTKGDVLARLFQE